jgi:hypothetical protein
MTRPEFSAQQPTPIQQNVLCLYVHIAPTSELCVSVKKPTRKWHIWFLATHSPTLKNQKSHFLPPHDRKLIIFG